MQKISMTYLWMLVVTGSLTFGVVRADESQKAVPQSELRTQIPEDVTPYSDSMLEGRLKVEQIYRVSGKESLSQVAQTVYGHKTWWVKVRTRNDELKNFKSEDLIPRNRVVKYLAPDVGDDYVVQKGDNLFRIALWKFGHLDSWKSVYEINQQKLSSADLIYPNVHLSMDGKGTIQVTEAKPTQLEKPRPAQVSDDAGEGAVAIAPEELMHLGAPKKNDPAPQTAPDRVASPTNSENPMADRNVSSRNSSAMREWLTFDITGVGLMEMIAVFIAVVGGLYFWRQRTARAPRHSGHAVEIDPELLSEEETDIDQRLSYHSLLRIRLKKYKKWLEKLKWGKKNKRA